MKERVCEESLGFAKADDAGNHSCAGVRGKGDGEVADEVVDVFCLVIPGLFVELFECVVAELGDGEEDFA